MLRPGGVLLIVQSSVADVAKTCALMRDAGLRPEVMVRSPGPFGPVLQERAPWLEEQGLIAKGALHEDLVVVRGVRT